MVTFELILTWLLHAAVSFIASFCVAIIYHTPKKHIVPAGITGSFGWVVYVILTHFGVTVAFASFFATVALTVMARLFASTRKAPVPIFLVTGIFPLVPGLGIYNTGYSLFMSGNSSETLNLGLTTVSIAIAIALGMGLVLTVPQSVFSFICNRKGNKNETNH